VDEWMSGMRGKMQKNGIHICVCHFFVVPLQRILNKEGIMSTIVFQPQDQSQLAFLTDFAKRVSVPYVIVPLNVETLLNREEVEAQNRAKSFAQLQESFSKCDLTDEEIRKECEAVRQQMYEENYAH
jgi:hypothetical protein